jgi:hypothetical protein
VSKRGCGKYGVGARPSRRERKKAASPEDQMNVMNLSRGDYWMKKARESWVTPFFAGTVGGFFMFWI